jgi:hypothetical protein
MYFCSSIRNTQSPDSLGRSREEEIRASFEGDSDDTLRGSLVMMEIEGT